jgi:hypothetical protein
MEAFLVVLGEILIEFVVQMALYFPFDRPGSSSNTGNFFVLILGGALGGLSLFVFQSTLIDWPALRIANLVVAPLAAGFLFRAVARQRAKKNYGVVPRDHFWRAFWFTLGWLVVRFVWARRG